MRPNLILLAWAGAASGTLEQINVALHAQSNYAMHGWVAGGSYGPISQEKERPNNHWFTTDARHNRKSSEQDSESENDPLPATMKMIDMHTSTAGAGTGAASA